MDMTNLTASSNQLDSMIQRRPSLSLLSSTLGYELSTYGNAGAHAGRTPDVAAPTIAQSGLLGGLSKIYLGILNHSSNTDLGHNIHVQPVTNDVGPWVELQKQQQSLIVDGLDEKKGPSPGKVTSRPMSVSISNAAIDDDDDDDDDLIPTAIVIKNIPFAIKKEQLLDVMDELHLPLPYAFNYHFDNGVFRGLAFANFTNTDETSLVVNQLNGREIGGRKLRVEYKKMLPLQERERIEREKREKRGQLEEQHRLTSNASLASLFSAASTTAATKNLSVNGQQYSQTQTERSVVHFPSGNLDLPPPPMELNFNDPEILELYLQLLTYRDDNSKLIYELAFSANLTLGQRKVLSLMCSFLNLLELYDNGYIIIRRKQGQQSIQQRQQQQTTVFSHVHLLSQGGIPQQTPSHVGGQNGGTFHSAPQATSMMNLSQLSALTGTYSSGHSQQQLLQQQQQQQQQLHLHLQQQQQQHQQHQQQTLQHIQNQQHGQPHHHHHHHAHHQLNPPELLRSHSQSALPLPRLRQQASTPVQQQFPPFQGSGGSQSAQKPSSSAGQGKFSGYNSYGNVSGPATLLGTPASSAAALLRSSNNRSYVDVRSTPQYPGASSSVTGSPVPQHAYPSSSQGYYVNGSQPGTPLAGGEIANRFAPFGQHPHLSGSMSSLQPSSATGEEFPLGDPLSGKLNALNMTGGSIDPQKLGGGIWGTKR